MNKKKNLVKKKKFNKPNFNQKNNRHPYFFKKSNRYLNRNNVYYLLGEKKPSKPLITEYLHRNKKKKIGIFFKKPSFKTILYPFHLNLKLINEYLKKN